MMRAAWCIIFVDTVVKAQHTSRATVPSGCLPSPKLPNNARCLFADQCSSNFCCPYFKTCQPTGLNANVVKDDPVRSAAMYGVGGPKSAYGPRAGNTGNDICAAGQMSTVPMGLCDDGTSGGPQLTSAMGGQVLPWDISDKRCICDSRFKREAAAGTWTGTYNNGNYVNACPGGVVAGSVRGGTASKAAFRMAPATGVAILGAVAAVLSSVWE